VKIGWAFSNLSQTEKKVSLTFVFFVAAAAAAAQ
jgi:hypothetical protein